MKAEKNLKKEGEEETQKKKKKTRQQRNEGREVCSHTRNTHRSSKKTKNKKT